MKREGVKSDEGVRSEKGQRRAGTEGKDDG